MESGAAGKSWLQDYLESPLAKPFIFLCKNDITDLMPELLPSSCPCLKQRCLRATRTLGWGRHQIPLQQDTACCRHFCTSFSLEKQFHSSFCAEGTQILCWEGTGTPREKETHGGPSCSPQCLERRVESGSAPGKQETGQEETALSCAKRGLSRILGEIS